MVRKVLSVCYDRCLPLRTLEFLKRAGCETTCAPALGAALQFLYTINFDLILVNQTVSTSQEHLFVKLVRQKTEIPIIFVCENFALKPNGVNACLTPPVTGEELLRWITELVPNRNENKSFQMTYAQFTHTG